MMSAIASHQMCDRKNTLHNLVGFLENPKPFVTINVVNMNRVEENKQ